jgi:cold-inducible RNA-binding protein
MKLYVGNMSFDSSETELRKAFEAFGAVESVTIIMDRDTGRPKGFGFVEMSNDAEAKKAIEGLNGKDFMGRALNVNEARPRTDGPRRGGSSGPRRSF